MRYAISLGAGSFVTVLLFLVMDGLIADPLTARQSDPSQRIRDYIYVPVLDTEHKKVRELQPPPQPPAEPPPPPTYPRNKQPAPAPLIPNISIPVIRVIGPTDGPWLPDGPTQGQSDQGLVAIFKIAPDYPRDAALDGTQGWVDVALEVAPDGTVISAQVVGSEPQRVFDQAALRAIYRWKFRPRIVDGVAVRQAARTRLQFVL